MVVTIIALTAALVLVLATRHAWQAYGQPFPSLLVDPYGSVSNVSLPSWPKDAGNPSATFPDRVVAVDGVALEESAGRRAADVLRDRIGEVHRKGRTEIELTLERERGTVAYVAPIVTVGLEEELVFFLLYALCAVLTVWSGCVAYFFAERRPSARAYLFWSIGAFLFLSSFFDYHTTARLPWLFGASTLWVTLGFLGLAMTFPEPEGYLASLLTGDRLRWVPLVGAALSLLWGLGITSGPSESSIGARTLVTALLPASAALLVVVLAVRFIRSAGRRRDEVRAALFGLAAAPAVVAAACIGFQFQPMAVVHFMAPLLVALIPVSLGVSLIRHNVLEWHAVATTRLVLPPVFVFAAVAGVLVFLVVNRAASPPASQAALAATVSGVAFLGAFVALRRAGLQSYFPSTTAFRPTIEQLSDELREATGRDEVVRAILRVIEHRLAPISASIIEPCGAREELTPDQWKELLRGESVFTAGAPSVRSLLVPLRSSGELRAVLRCSPKPSGALYLREDIALLETIAGVGALALHNAEVMVALNQMRRLQVGAAEHEKRLAISALAAELSHEINHSLIFFRYLLSDADDRPLVPDDVTIGRNEVARLQRTLGHLRRLDIPPSAVSAVPLLGTVRHAEALVRDVIQTKSLSVHLDVPKDLEVIASPDPLLQVFSNLLRNAAQAAPEQGNLGVDVRLDGADLVIDVWDDGPGVPEGLERRIFQPWVTMTEGGTGLGLAVAQRIVASFGWTISVRRVEGRTYFTIRAHRTVPPGSPGEAKE